MICILFPYPVPVCQLSIKQILGHLSHFDNFFESIFKEITFQTFSSSVKLKNSRFGMSDLSNEDIQDEQIWGENCENEFSLWKYYFIDTPCHPEDKLSTGS